LTDLLNLDIQKKILAYHGNYSSSEIYRELDKDQNGYLTADELHNYFVEQDGESPEENEFVKAGFDFNDLIKAWDTNGDGRLTYTEFQRGLNAYGVGGH